MYGRDDEHVLIGGLRRACNPILLLLFRVVFRARSAVGPKLYNRMLTRYRDHLFRRRSWYRRRHWSELRETGRPGHKARHERSQRGLKKLFDCAWALPLAQ